MTDSSLTRRERQLIRLAEYVLAELGLTDPVLARVELARVKALRDGKPRHLRLVPPTNPNAAHGRGDAS